MRSVSYNFYDVCRVAITGLSPMALTDINCRYLWFCDGSGGDPDIDISVGDFVPDTTGALRLEGQFYVRPDYIYWQDRVKGLNFKAEVQGLDNPPIRVRYYAPPANRLRFPWTLFPDLVLHLYVLQPLVEHVLARNGIYLLHCAAVARDSCATLIGGRGGIGKTCFAMALVRRGYELLGDDMVAVSSGRILPFPMETNWFKFLLDKANSDRMNLGDQFGLFLHLLGHSGRPALPVAEPARPTGLNLVYQHTRSGITRSAVTADEALIALQANQELERYTYVSHRYVIGLFLDVYGFLFPECEHNRYWSCWREEIRRTVASQPTRRINIPASWTSDALESLVY